MCINQTLDFRNEKPLSPTKDFARRKGRDRRKPARNPQPDADQLEAAADQAIAACGGDAREAVKALIVANHFLEKAVSPGYARLPRDRKERTFIPTDVNWILPAQQRPPKQRGSQIVQEEKQLSSSADAMSGCAVERYNRFNG